MTIKEILGAKLLDTSFDEQNCKTCLYSSVGQAYFHKATQLPELGRTPANSSTHSLLQLHSIPTEWALKFIARIPMPLSKSSHHSKNHEGLRSVYGSFPIHALRWRRIVTRVVPLAWHPWYHWRAPGLWGLCCRKGCSPVRVMRAWATNMKSMAILIPSLTLACVVLKCRFKSWGRPSLEIIERRLCTRRKGCQVVVASMECVRKGHADRRNGCGRRVMLVPKIWTVYVLLLGITCLLRHGKWMCMYGSRGTCGLLQAGGCSRVRRVRSRAKTFRGVGNVCIVERILWKRRMTVGGSETVSGLGPNHPLEQSLGRQ